ncbi:MAG: patatin family protein [Clostridia bacterium]|nr:patatin family protein [Clostridia bacterium]
MKKPAQQAAKRQKTERKTVYSRLERIPEGNADSRIMPGCLVLEGGAFRGVYTSGVLDVLMQNGINLDTTIGVSAGALNALGYVSGQIGRSARIILRYRHDPRYVGLGPVLNRKDRGVIGFDFMLDQMNRIEPLNVERLMDPGRRLIAVATAITTGWPVYFERRQDVQAFYKAVQASASMPYVSSPVTVQGIRCLDGGCSVKIPFEWALEHGYKKVVVVRTRDRSYRPQRHDLSRAAGSVYGDYPEFAAALANMNESYIRELEILDRLESEGRIFQIVPSLPIQIGRLESDMEKLGDVYWQGVHDAKENLERLKDYLKA